MATYPFSPLFSEKIWLCKDWNPHSICGNDDLVWDTASLTLERDDCRCGNHFLMIFCYHFNNFFGRVNLTFGQPKAERFSFNGQVEGKKSFLPGMMMYIFDFAFGSTLSLMFDQTINPNQIWINPNHQLVYLMWSLMFGPGQLVNDVPYVPCFSLLGKKKLHKFELACLANLCPETAEEAKALIPRWVSLLMF